ncbi:cytochrome b/b6 domain-containing protein [Protaetiibacter intestinalis]|uniref:Cytochrome b561 bacterial/Ni-hydrogenase domain-containing protein n=1 Tax=Protaetiibacter intestinalis TaxID=2419774 RepID=A0A387B8Y6_9MICO|nr:cytochrome b/b6 domain-containing protein [Protaetiibacter intestinalis]AYF97645.1 hypothetical protein D7I47_04800 [Protaetiibacter intestinalis]
MTTAPPSDPRRRRIRWVVAGALLVAFAVVVVLVARWLTTLDPVAQFLARYPGYAPMPADVPVGIPAWLGWQHFLNALLLVLIVRTGWRSRGEKRPDATWTSRRNRRRRMSLTVWTHLALDVLWVANGVVYLVLLFATGHWMRVVPTDWAVVPNALSATLQYASLQWPLEQAWVTYNALQQLSYFAVVFVAAPLAIVTGVRMSAYWPRDAARVNRIYPFALATRVHLPVMFFFVAFTVTHVVLVLATDALRNLNAIYTARDASDWWGFAVFLVSLAAIAGAWALLRPPLLDRAANTVGEVTRR